MTSQVERSGGLGDEGEGVSKSSGAAGATNTVNVVVVGGWLVKIDNVGNVFDINAAGGDVGSNEDFYLIGFELAKGIFALVLTLVSMNGTDVKAGVEEVAKNILYPVFGTAKDKHLFELLFFAKKFAEKVDFGGAARGPDDVLFDIAGSGSSF